MIHPEDPRTQAPPAAPTPAPGTRKVNKWQKVLAALVLLICLVGAGFLIVQNGRSAPVASSPSSGATPVLPKPWCTAPNALANTFYGSSISSLATNDVWSAGAQVTHWNGNAWTVSFTPASQQDVLRSIVEIAPDDIWVVGEHQGNGMASHPLTLHWDGSKWQNVTGPDAAAGGKNALVAVSGTAANDVWAVGFSVPLAGPIAPLIEHWNGSKWSITHLSLSTSLQFTSIKALAPNNAWAVGYEYGTHAGKNFIQPVTEHWNGTHWSAITNPNLSASGGGSLYNINGDAANDLWAVGSQNSGSEMLSEHWNGSKWSIIASPQVSPSNSNWLASVAVSAPDNVWAVGRVGSSQSGFQPFIEHWNGQQWQVMQDPTNNAGELDIIANVGQQFWVVGLPRLSGGHAFIETLCP
jgi:hypothetical protein